MSQPDYALTPAQRDKLLTSGVIAFPAPRDAATEAERTREVAKIYAALPKGSQLRRSLLDLTELDGHRVRHHVRKL